jgi:hypothetical protein
MAIHLRADGLVVVPDWNSASCGVVWSQWDPYTE